MWSTQASDGFTHSKLRRGAVLGNRNKPTFAASSWDSGAQGGLASWSKVAGAEEAKDRSTAWDGSGSRRGLEEVAASQLNCSKTPADRLKQLAAWSRSEKLRAAAQQLKETATSGGHLVSTIPECQQSLHSTVVQPAVAGISDDDLDLLLDDINSGLLPDNLPTQGADRRSLYPSRTSSSLGKPRALQALAFAEDDIGSQEPSPALLDVRAKDRQAAHVEAGVQADAVAPASFSSPQEPAGSVDSWADAATGHLGSLEARLPQPSLQAAAAAMQNRLERLRSSLSALDGGLPANQPVAPCGVALAQHIAAAKVAIKDQQCAALSSYNHRLEAGRQDPQARRLSAALVVTQAPKPVSAAAAATLDEAQVSTSRWQEVPGRAARCLDYPTQLMAVQQGSASSVLPETREASSPAVSSNFSQLSGLSRIRSMSMGRAWAGKSAAGSQQEDVLEAWRRRRRAERQAANETSPASSSGSSSRQQQIAAIQHCPQQQGAWLGPSVSPAKSPQRQWHPLALVQARQPSSTHTAVVLASSGQFSSSSAAAPSMAASGRAAITPAYPQAGLGRYSKYLLLAGDASSFTGRSSAATAGLVEAARPQSTPPALALHSKSLGPSAPHLQQRVASADPSLGRPSGTAGSGAFRADIPASQPGQGGADDILERWRARRRQLQSQHAAPGRATESGYDYASVLLLQPQLSTKHPEDPNGLLEDSRAAGRSQTEAGDVEACCRTTPTTNCNTLEEHRGAPAGNLTSSLQLDCSDPSARLQQLCAILQKPQAHPPRLEEGQPVVPPKQDTVSGPADAKAGAEQPRLEPCYQASLAVVELTDTSGPLRPPVDDGAALVAGGTAPSGGVPSLLPCSMSASLASSRCSSGHATPRSNSGMEGRQSTMWSPSMNQLVDDVLDELFFHGDSSAPLALPAPASPDPAHANAQPALGLAKEQLPSRLS